MASKTLRILIALITRWDLEARQADVVNAFPNANLDEDVYIELPSGFKIPKKIVLLLKALYGLRRSLLLWQRLLTEAFLSIGLQRVPDEPYVMVNAWLIVFFFVDDIIYAYRAQDEAKAAAFRQ